MKFIYIYIMLKVYWLVLGFFLYYFVEKESENSYYN